MRILGQFVTPLIQNKLYVDKLQCPSHSKSPVHCPLIFLLKNGITVCTSLSEREGKLRQLRRACGDVESENAELETHMKALNSMISRSEQDAVRLFAHAQMLSHQMNMLKASVLQRLNSVPAATTKSRERIVESLPFQYLELNHIEIDF